MAGVHETEKLFIAHIKPVLEQIKKSSFAYNFNHLKNCKGSIKLEWPSEKCL